MEHIKATIFFYAYTKVYKMKNKCYNVFESEVRYNERE